MQCMNGRETGSEAFALNAWVHVDGVWGGCQLGITRIPGEHGLCATCTA